MDNDRSEPDWSLWRSFAAVVDTGSLSAAARRLGLTQPTLGRHVEELETRLDARLFQRAAKGLHPTETALRLYESVARARAALADATLAAQGANASLSGTVRITSSTVTSHYILPPLLADLRRTFPGIALELVPTDSVENLLLRESDIAVRMFRPTQNGLVARRIGHSPITACAHETYLAARGAPAHPDELTAHDLVGFDRADLLIDASRDMGFALKRDDFAMRTDSHTAGWELLKAGLGIGFAQALLVREAPGMVALLPQLQPPPLEVWLTTHRELFTSRRIRAIYDRLAETLGAYFRRAGISETSS